MDGFPEVIEDITTSPVLLINNGAIKSIDYAEFNNSFFKSNVIEKCQHN
jgi:hypothetical protein